MNNNLDHPFYYLENFRFVLTWVLQRYSDLLGQDEINFIDTFAHAPIQSQALLVRMVMRKGDLFRSSKLDYQEIGDANIAAQFLIEQEWLHVDPHISFEQLFAVTTKMEFAHALGLADRKILSKAEMLELVHIAHPEARHYSKWNVSATDSLYEVCVGPLCDRIRLMFFGNLYQDWSEFVLTDLGIFAYEKVQFSDASRAFQSRHDIDTYMRLQACRDRLHNGEPLQDIEREIDAIECISHWLQMRRAKIRFQIGQQYEKCNDWENAHRIYVQCDYVGARLRRIRVLEKNGQIANAMALAELAAASPESAAELQHIDRTMPRLQRKLGLGQSAKSLKPSLPRFDLNLPKPVDIFYVEEVARLHIEQSHEGASVCTSVYYVENTLINSLFGLLCWDAIFSIVPGAFFHPFQIGPADLHSADFRKQRSDQFHHALSQLKSQQYKQTIRETFIRKAGIQSPFISWGMLSESLLEQALQCFPAKHLSIWFDRILDDIAANRNGFPDLIQFWPQQNRYRMIEIKGPGDRLQDNQIRFLDFCLANDMPVAVCYVEWTDPDI